VKKTPHCKLEKRAKIPPGKTTQKGENYGQKEKPSEGENRRFWAIEEKKMSIVREGLEKKNENRRPLGVPQGNGRGWKRGARELQRTSERGLKGGKR